MDGTAFLQDHILRMRQLRPGLHLHADATHDPHDLTARSEMASGLRIVLLLEGSVDISYGQRHVVLSSRDGSDSRSARHTAKGLLVSVAEPDQFRRRARKGIYARRLSLSLGMDWIAQATSGTASARLQDFMRQHLALQHWRASERAVALAEQMVRPPALEPLLQNLYLESRALELTAEALGAMGGDPPAATQASTALRPQEHRRMRELREFLSSPHADDLSLDDIARHAGINANTLQRQFRELYGTTVFDYLRESRLQRARRALEHDGLSVGQAAMVAGYTSAANFATAYKRRFGLAPKLARSRV